MESITVIAQAGDLHPVFKSRIREALPQCRISDQGNLIDFVLHGKGSDRLYFDYEGTALDNIIGWSETEVALMQKHFPLGFHVYSIHYRSVETMRVVLMNIADSSQMLVYNDFDTMLLGPNFVQKIQAEPNWDWRNDLKQD